ncbi:MAG: tRNA dihydrouridine synthase DusB [Sedimenticola sp.]|nr:tRNA dihydrouridine synthase DusB [Sedimenticola sp.]
MRIGPYQLDNNLLVAPMAGVTDRPFRQLCRQLGAGMAVSEMISSNSALRGTRKTVKRLDFEGEPGPISVQILGADPKTMAEAAKVNVGHGAQIIDINMGCPAKKVCKVAAGSALLNDPSLVKKILESVVQAVEVPVTLKIRTGWDPANRNGLEIAKIAEASGIQALAIHGRTRACGYSGNAEYETISSIKQALSIPIIANGDIDSPEKAKKVLELTGADAIMIGRAAQGRPWIFREIAHYLNTGEKHSAPHPVWIRDILLGHLENLYAFYGEFQGVRIARKHIAWYSKTQPGGALFRKRINTTDSTEKQKALISEFFDQLAINKERAA